MASFLDWLFGSGDSTVTNKVDIPKYYKDASKGVIKTAMNAGDWYAQPYKGDTYANLTRDQRGLINRTIDNVGNTNAGYNDAMRGTRQAMNYDPRMVRANNRASTVDAGAQGYQYDPMQVRGGSFLDMNVGNYMNPMTDAVERQALARLDEQRLRSQNGNADSAIAAKAFGGSADAIQRAVTNAESAKAAGDLSANLRSNAFSNATQLMGQDLQRGFAAQQANQSAGLQNAQFGANVGLQNNALDLQGQQANQAAQLQAAGLNQQAALANQQAGLQGAQLNMNAANQLGNLTTDKQNAFLQSLQSGLAAGGMVQADQQGNLTQALNRYNANRQYPVDVLNMQIGALNGTQLPTGSTQTTSNPSSPLMQALGLGMAGASFLSSPIFGGMFGGAAGGFGLSDRSTKTNIEKIGKDPETGLDLYAYDYKADVEAAKRDGTPLPMKRVGPMAQDVEKMHPGATRKVGGKMIVANLGIGG